MVIKMIVYDLFDMKMSIIFLIFNLLEHDAELVLW